jgi:nucleoside-diphosphate-sugar epimerase
MVALVTGGAGFVGSHLTEALLDRGPVRVVDAFTPFYDRALKEANIAKLRGNPGFSLIEGDLVDLPLDLVLADVDAVFHLAGQPGVRPSWGREFEGYVHHNVLATQRLLEACKERDQIAKVVYASSSSVYGDAESYPTPETLRPQPVSPYGVTKLSAEHLCELYRTNFDVPTVSLRLFTVYGPRQRPDMAFRRLIEAGMGGTPFALYGDGRQTRDFTFVDDVVAAMLAAAAGPWCGVANIGGGARTDMRRVIEIVTELVGAPVIVQQPTVHGDVRDTAADITQAAEAFGYRPRTGLQDGLSQMAAAMDNARVVTKR